MSMLGFHRNCASHSGCIPFYSAGRVAEGHGFTFLSTMGICHLLILAIVLLKKLCAPQEYLLPHVFWTSMWSPKSKSSISVFSFSAREPSTLQYIWLTFLIPQSLFMSLILRFSRDILFLCYGHNVFCYFLKILLICLFGIFLLVTALLVSFFCSCLCFTDFSAFKLEVTLRFRGLCPSFIFPVGH